MRAPRTFVVSCALVASAVAGPVAPPPTVVALASGASDARDAIAIGPHGQAYLGDGKGAWTRTHAGGIADEVVRATRSGNGAIVGVEAGPPYRLDKAGSWQMLVLGLHAKAVLGRGSRATAAFGRHVFELETGTPKPLGDAPGVVSLLAAGKTAVVAQTDKGIVRFETSKWKPIPKAPAQAIALLDDRWALVDRGVFDLDAGKLVAWPSGFRVSSVSAVDRELVVAAGTIGANPELVTVTGKAAKLDHELITVKLTAPIVSIVGDRAGRVVIAARDGSLAVRGSGGPAGKGAWVAATVRDELPADKPGSPPAESR